MGFLGYNVCNMSIIDDLINRGKKHKERIEEYNAKAYPFGLAQKQLITSIVQQLMPKEDKEIAIYNFLICKQEIIDKSAMAGKLLNYNVVYSIVKEFKKKFNFKDSINLYKCIALAEADINIDSLLNYPSIEELINRAYELKEILD